VSRVVFRGVAGKGRQSEHFKFKKKSDFLSSINFKLLSQIKGNSLNVTFKSHNFCHGRPLRLLVRSGKISSYASGCVNKSVLFIYLFNFFCLAHLYLLYVTKLSSGPDSTVSNNKRTH